MDNLLLLKLNRTIWVSLLEQEKIIEAISYFESYQNSLLMLKAEKTLKDEIMREVKYSQDVFLSRMVQFAQDYVDSGDYTNAAICYTSIFKYDQNNIDNLRDYIKCLDELGQYDLEIGLVEHLKNIGDNDIESYRLLSEICSKRNEIEKTIEYYEKYLTLKGESNITANEYNQLGCYYNLLYSNKSAKYSDIIKSLTYFEKAAKMEPFVRLFHKNATIMASKANALHIGRKHWDALLEIGQMTNDDKYDYAAFCLRSGNFEEWHKYFDSRFDKEHNRTIYPKIFKPKWDGVKDLSHSTLLVHHEQGFGDTFLMWGYMPRLLKLAKHVIFVVQDSIYELLKDNEWGVEVLPSKGTDLNKLKFDYHIPSMSVPVALKLNKDNLSVGEGYIKPNIDLVKQYKEKYFNNDKFKIGISFSGSPSGNLTRNISVENFLPLDKLDGIEIYSLTKGVEDSKFDCFKNNKVVNIAKDFNNFADTAAAMANLDVVLTSDNCILNLAGALGLKTFGLFNWHYEFRWFDLSGENVVWLTSVKPFVNNGINAWESSIEPAVEEIKKMKNELAGTAGII